MWEGKRLILAIDDDPGGHALADQIEAIAREAGWEDLAVIRHQSAGEGQD
jgi:hypothetical protein